MSPQFRLITLGGAGLEGPEGSLSGRVAQPRSIALLTLLALGPGVITRDKLLGYLWPESDKTHGRHLLSNVLYHMRRRLGENAIIGSGETLRLAHEMVAVDVHEFTQALSRGDLARAGELYRGPFLDGFYLSDAPEFERWGEAEQSRLTRAYAHALENAASACEKAADASGAIALWSRLAAHDPYSSRAVLRLARVLLAGGDTGEALRALQQHAHRLRDDLAIQPAPEITALLEQLRPAFSTSPAPSGPRRSSNGRNGRNGRDGRKEAEHDRPATSVAHSTSAPEIRRRFRVSLRDVVAAAAVFAAVSIVALAVIEVLPRLSDSEQRGSLYATGALDRSARVLISDFDGSAADTAVGALVTEAIRIDLEQSRSISVYSVDRIPMALRRMEVPLETPVRGPVARDLAAREGIAVRLEGAVRSAGPGYVLTARLTSTADDSVLASFREAASSPRQLMGAVNRLSKSIRAKIGESLRQVGAAPALEQATTASLEALQHYSLARRAMRQGDRSAALRLLEHAVALDTTFAMAHSILSRVRLASGDEPGAAEARATAYRLRAKLPDVERYKLEGMYWWQEGDPDRAAAAWEAVLQLQPRNIGGLNNLATYYGTREPAKFEELAARAYREDSTVPPSASNYAVALYRAGRFDDAHRAIRTSQPLQFGGQLGDLCMLASRGELAAAERGMLELWTQAHGRPSQHMDAAWALAAVTGIQGRLRESVQWMEQAKGGPGLSRVDSVNIETVIAGLAVFNAGDTAKARRHLERSVARLRPETIGVESRPLLALARVYTAVGLNDQAKAALRTFEDSAPRGVYWRERQVHYHLRAVAALADRDMASASRDFRRSGLEGCRICEHWGLARVHDANGHADSAIAEFERYFAVRDPCRIYHDSFQLPRALERAGQLYEMRGDSESGVTYYERFAELWKDADLELQPRVRAALAAASRLRQEGPMRTASAVR